MILACGLTITGEVNKDICAGFMSQIIFPTEQACYDNLAMGIMVVEQRGWYVVDYRCFDWKQERTKPT